ncbi:TerD protein [Bacillus phage YungSlug]|nr:TerD protein [Bacillus phage YungSlug]
MAVNLGKGGVVDLTKTNPGLKNITVGLSWGQAQEVVTKESNQKQGGILSRLFGGNNNSTPQTVTRNVDMDIDSSVVVVDGRGSKTDLIYYGNKRGLGIHHMGDDLTGRDKQGVHDNEEININLAGLDSGTKRLIFVANIYNAGRKHFGMVKGAYIRVLNADNREELVRFNLAEEFANDKGIIVAEMYRNGNEWDFKAVGKGTGNAGTLNEVVRQSLNN